MMRKKETVPAYASVIKEISKITNHNYQVNQWVARENPKDYGCYENTILYFMEDSDAVLSGRDAGRIEMTDAQYTYLKKLNEMVEAYDTSQERPDEDKDIVNDPKWHEIREYAKLVYNELIKE